MALDNYANLKSTIIRADGSNDIVDVLDDAIDICEAKIYSNPEAVLLTRDMETRSTATLSTTDRFLALPDNYVKMRGLRLLLSSGNQDIRYSTPESLEVVAGAGKPRNFTVTSQIEFDRIADSAYTVEISFYEKPTALSDSNTTNVVLTNYPDIYLSGCLWAVNNFFNDEPDVAANHYASFIGAIKGANKQDRKGRFGPAPRMRVEGSTP